MRRRETRAGRGIAAALLAAGLFGSAQAELIDNGNGTVYDTTTDLTWLKDANHGPMDWVAANSWAASLTFNTHSSAGTITGWRLPKATPVGGGAGFNANFSYDGTTDLGYNLSAQAGELGHLFFQLGNRSLFDVAGNIQTNSGLVNKGPFVNVPPASYWCGTSYGVDNYFSFDLATGYQDISLNNPTAFYVWAVHDGNVGAVRQSKATVLLVL